LNNISKTKWSQFVFFVRSKGHKKIIAHNTLNNSTVRMTKQIKDIIDSVIAESAANKKIESDLLPLYIKKYIQKLIQLEILVPLKLDEKAKYLKLFNQNRQKKDKTFLITLITTRSCQLNCPYCFEKGISRKEQLTIETAKKIVLWCQNYLHQHQDCDKLKVVLSGGEPLLNKEVIKYILPKLNHIAREKQLLFELDMITNGELLDIKTLSFLNRYNMKAVQITIDGPKEIHDKRRIRKDGKGTFDKIMQNIVMAFHLNLLKKVHLGINFDRQNVHLIPALFDFFAMHHLQQKIELTFNVIFPTINEQLNQKVSHSHFKKFGLSEIESAHQYLWLCQEAKKRGFNIPPKWQFGPLCPATKIHSVVAEPNGDLLKCRHAVGYKEFIFGNISSTSEAYDPNYNKFGFLKKCLSKGCPLVPLCSGGCRFQAFLSSGSFSKPYCRSKFIEKVNKGLVQLNFG